MRYTANVDRDHLQKAMRLKALGHPVRLGIALRLAAEPETCACDFAEVFGVSQPTISQHLRVLREAGLVEARTDAQRRLYRLRTEPLREIDEWLAPYRAAWAGVRSQLSWQVLGQHRAGMPDRLRLGPSLVSVNLAFLGCRDRVRLPS